MPGENPGAYDEARKRIRETKEQEEVVIEKKKEDFEKGREKLFSKKRLDIFELRRRIDTGHSLNSLKSDIEEALKNGQISIDTYTNTIELLHDRQGAHDRPNIVPEYTLDPLALPFSQGSIARYFDGKKIGENPVLDIAGFTYGVFQGSVFLLYLAGKCIIDTLLLPRDIYTMIKK